MKRRAFTLIELLVVIAIIGLLSTIAVINLASSRKQARNAKRIADTKQLVTAFNLGFDANGTFPVSATWKCVGASCGGCWAAYTADAGVNAFLSPYLSSLPTDPNDSNSRTCSGYVYNGTGGGAFPNGHLIDYLLEPPATCGPGALRSTTANYVECLILLDNY